MTRTPLPAANDDPNVIAARQAEVTYTQMIGTLRSDPMLSDLARAERIDMAWQTLQSARANLSETFYGVRRARLDELEAQTPIGPNIPADTNRADAVVLHQAFTAALAKARDADLTGLTRMWGDAQRFDDDVTRRAVLTESLDRGLNQFINEWATGDPVRKADLAEIVTLRDVFVGRGTDKALAAQAFGTFGLPRQPQESLDLPVLQRQAEALQARRARGFVA